MTYTAESLVREIARMNPESADYEETLRTLIGEAKEIMRRAEPARNTPQTAISQLRANHAQLTPEAMKVKVRFETKTHWEAELTYDDLARAWSEDADQHAGEPRSPLPSPEEILRRHDRTVPVNEYADSEVDQLIQDNGYEIDGDLAYITEIEAVEET